jgi:hypothetical protein
MSNDGCRLNFTKIEASQNPSNVSECWLTGDKKWNPLYNRLFLCGKNDKNQQPPLPIEHIT